jgi:hypothetical protein
VQEKLDFLSIRSTLARRSIGSKNTKENRKMRHNTSYRSSLLILGALCVAAGEVSTDVTPSERQKALRYLDETRDGVLNAVKGLSEAQWKFKPAPDRWSAAEVLEHLVLIEEMVDGILGKIGEAPAGAAERDAGKVDAMILAKVPDRSEKVQAPPPALPTGRWTSAGTLEHFLNSRMKTGAILQSASALRGHVVTHPVFGPLDGYEWILAVAAHSERHTKQILEVKTDPHFPAPSR